MLLARARLVGAAAVLAGCPAPGPQTCHVVPADGGAVGDTSAVVLVAAGEDGVLVELHDGSPVPLVHAPQGGHILLVGAKLKSTSDCMLDATGALRDPATNRVLGLDERTLLLTTVGGWSQPSDPPLSSMPNVAVCPSAAATLSVDGNPYTLEVTLRDGATIVAMLTATVTPTCAAGDGFCHTECAPVH